VVGGDADVRRALLDHLEHRLQHADHRAERPVAALGEAAQAVEVAEQLVGAVDQMDDHRQILSRRSSALRSVTAAPPTGIPIAPSAYPITRSADPAVRRSKPAMKDFEPSTLWRISAFEQARERRLGGRGRPSDPACRRRCSPTCSSCTAIRPTTTCSRSIAACVRNREAALLYLAHGRNVWPVTLFPREEVYHSPRDASQMTAPGMSTLRVISAEPPGVKPPGDAMHERIAAQRPLPPARGASSGRVALQGPRATLLTEISGRVAYRLVSSASPKDMPSSLGALSSAVRRLRNEAASLRDVASWPG
jgi:hypothetical protein